MNDGKRSFCKSVLGLGFLTHEHCQGANRILMNLDEVCYGKVFLNLAPEI